MTPESTEIAAIVDGFPAEAREGLRDSVRRLAESYRAIGIGGAPLAELRRAYREAHPEEFAPNNDNVIVLANRRPKRNA